MRSLEDKKNYGLRLEEKLKALNLVKEALKMKNGKSFSMEKDDFLMALRYKNDEMTKLLDASKREASNLKKTAKDNDMKLSRMTDEISRSNSKLGKLRKSLEKQKSIVSVKNIKSVKILSEQEAQHVHGQLVRKSTKNKAQIEVLLRENALEIRKLKDKIKEKDLNIEKMDITIKKLNECNDEKEKGIKKRDLVIEELNIVCIVCTGVKKWKDEYVALRLSYESMQKKLKDEIGDVQLENDRVMKDLKKMSKAYEESESCQKKLRHELSFERSRGNKLEICVPGCKARS